MAESAGCGLISSEHEYNARHCARLLNLSFNQRKHRCHVKCRGIAEMDDGISTVIVESTVEPCP